MHINVLNQYIYEQIKDGCDDMGVTASVYVLTYIIRVDRKHLHCEIIQWI